MSMQEYLICPRETFHWRMSADTPGGSGKRIPELLAPAGSKEALYAAIAAGADAVYLGGPRFGARHYAANFSEEGIAEAVEHAHLRRVRVYVTVNTLVQDRELPDAMRYLLTLYAMGVDAVLIQDVGLLALSRDLIPGLCLHASTQCTISTREGAAWAAKAGFSRVVVARETPLSEIDRMLAPSPEMRPGIEVFVHGALCYSYSGQCLLSSVIGGRSANRGMCAQPCRKPYRLVRCTNDRYARPVRLSEVPVRDRYLLSTRDLCCYPCLEDIADRDIEALKIEGRMRSPGYVASVVRAYRRGLDALKACRKWYSAEDVEVMAAAFSRGFTRGYLFGDRGPSLMGREHPGNRGLLIGRVAGTPDPEHGILVRPDSEYVPAAGDGILIVDPSGSELRGFALNKDAVRRRSGVFIPCAVTGAVPGSCVYLTGSTRIAGRIKGMAESCPPAQRIPVDLDIRIIPGKPLEGSAFCRGRDGSIVRVACATSFIPRPAEASPTGQEAIRRQLQKSGGTPFEVCSVNLDCREGPFIPLGELNQLRRDLLSALREAWIRSCIPGRGEVSSAASGVAGFIEEHTAGLSSGHDGPTSVKRPLLSVYCRTPEEIAAACDAWCDEICCEPEDPGWDNYAQSLVSGAAYCRERGVLFAWKWPWVTGPRFLEEALPRVHGLFEAGVRRVMVEELGMAEAVLSCGPGTEVLGGKGLNICNARAAGALHPPFAALTLSPELSGGQIAALLALSNRRSPGLRHGVICQGNLETMVSEDRLLETLTGSQDVPTEERFGLVDGTGRFFPVRQDRLGRTCLQNSVETCLIDRIPQLMEAGVSWLAIDARGRGPVYAREMTGLYREGIDAASLGKRHPHTWAGFRDRARAMARGGITAGHHERGVAGYTEGGAE